MEYDFYLFSRLMLDYKLVDKELEYDIAHGTTLGHYNEFLGSEFDDPEKGLYECIVDYINYYKINN